MRLRLSFMAAFAAVVGACAVTAATASAAPSTGAISAPITAAQSGGVLDGVFQIASFTLNSAGQLVANGTFTGTYTNASGATQTITSAASSVVTNAAAGSGGCQILDLTLGPLNLLQSQTTLGEDPKLRLRILVPADTATRRVLESACE